MPAHLTILRHGRATKRHALEPGTHRLGRQDSSAIVLADPSISRQHAELELSEDTAVIRDLDSQNGVLVNGVPRKTAVLQDGDRLTLGAVELLYTASTPPPQPAAGFTMALEPAERQQHTRRQAIRLPDQRTERHLAAFYHLCSWVTEGVEEANGLPRWLELLTESLRAHTLHFYSPKGKLLHTLTPEGDKPRVKFAPYLLERFIALPEATAYAPRELDRFQQRLGHYHYLVAPLRLGQPSREAPLACPIVAALRPADWEPFQTDDRVLLQTACQLWLKAVGRAAEVHQLRDENAELRAATKTGPLPADGLLGDSPALTKLRARLQRTAATKATVLIHGETGSGKEVVAGALHHHSPRAKHPYVKVNCGAIPGSLIESELFGHVKGAFTDAREDRKGKFAAAHQGTIFLDEIGELPLTAQTKLLRVLEEGLIEPLGSEKPRKINVRVLAATNRDLEAEVAAGRFRQDLYYRLNVITLTVPPLRSHLEDLPVLAHHFLAAFCAENGLAELNLAPDAIKALQKRPWPGNVRELRNTMQRLAIEATGASLTATDVRDLD